MSLIYISTNRRVPVARFGMLICIKGDLCHGLSYVDGNRMKVQNMSPPLRQITFRDIRSSPAVRAKILERIEKLDLFHPRISSCRVVVRAPHRHQHKGRLYNIRIDLKVPRREIVINREPTAHQAHQDIYVVIHDAFNALERRLEDVARRRRGDVKAHPEKSEIRLTAKTVRPAKRSEAAPKKKR